MPESSTVTGVSERPRTFIGPYSPLHLFPLQTHFLFQRVRQIAEVVHLPRESISREVCFSVVVTMPLFSMGCVPAPFGLSSNRSPEYTPSFTPCFDVSRCFLVTRSFCFRHFGVIQTHKRFKRTLFIRTKTLLFVCLFVCSFFFRFFSFFFFRFLFQILLLLLLLSDTF